MSIIRRILFSFYYTWTTVTSSFVPLPYLNYENYSKLNFRYPYDDDDDDNDSAYYSFPLLHRRNDSTVSLHATPSSSSSSSSSASSFHHHFFKMKREASFLVDWEPVSILQQRIDAGIEYQHDETHHGHYSKGHSSSSSPYQQQQEGDHGDTHCIPAVLFAFTYSTLEKNRLKSAHPEDDFFHSSSSYIQDDYVI